MRLACSSTASTSGTRRCWVQRLAARVRALARADAAAMHLRLHALVLLCALLEACVVAPSKFAAAIVCAPAGSCGVSRMLSLDLRSNIFMQDKLSSFLFEKWADVLRGSVVSAALSRRCLVFCEARARAHPPSRAKPTRPMSRDAAR